MADVSNDFDLPGWYEDIYQIVRRIPSGKVVTYGQVADAVEGYTLTARLVGTAMRFAPKDVPWHRVIGAGGRLPIAKRSPELKLLQRRLLEEEGAPFQPGNADCVDVAKCQWISEGPAESRPPQENLFELME